MFVGQVKQSSHPIYQLQSYSSVRLKAIGLFVRTVKPLVQAANMVDGKDVEATIPLNVGPFLYSPDTPGRRYNLVDSQSMPRASDVDLDMTHGENIEVK